MKARLFVANSDPNSIYQIIMYVYNGSRLLFSVLQIDLAPPLTIEARQSGDNLDPKFKTGGHFQEV